MEVMDIKSTFYLLKRGDKEIKLSEKYKDIVLVLGNTGSGKSTFTQWIAGNNDKLISKEVAEGTGEFIIEDNNNRIGNSTIESKTIFPELVIDSKTNTAYYDCPGFSDTRSTSNDIATTYFIKKVLDHAESVKMIFIINHSSVRKGVDRQDFMKLIRHATDLVRDVDKYQNSISIGVTKVDNQYIRRGTSFTLVEDNKVITAIADFLHEVKHDLKARVKLPNISVKELNFCDRALKFIDALFIKGSDNYAKIGIFRRPDQPGPLSNITILQEGKDKIEKILDEKLNFTKKENEDFGYTISETSKNDIIDLVKEINDKISSNVSDIAGQIQEYYRDLVAQMRDKIKSFVSSTAIVDANLSEAQTFSSKFSNNITLNLVEIMKNITNPEELAWKISNSTKNFDIKISEENVLDIINQGKYFNFLQIVSNKELSTRQWEKIFQSKLPNFSELREDLENDVNVTSQKINCRLNDTVKTIHEHYSKKMELLEIEKLPFELKNEHNVIAKLVKEIENAVTTNELIKKSQTIYDSANSLGISIPGKNIPIIVNRVQYFKFLQIVSVKKLNHETLTWICPFKDTVKYLDNSITWYTFLNSLYSKFSEYELQKDRSIYNVINLENWGTSGKPQGIEINKNNFLQFLNKTAEYNIAESYNITNITVTSLQLKELNHVLNLTLKQRMKINCSEPYISISGNYISIKSIRANIKNNIDMDDSCKDFSTVLKSEKFKFINVFALNTIFMDDDVLLEGSLPIVLIAPKWEVIDTRKISLNGYNGEITQSKAKDGAFLGGNGTDGKPGVAGGPGGTFFGIGDHFVNGAKLIINANGGKGGTGQNGGDGAKGTYEQNATLPSLNTCDESQICNAKIIGFKCKYMNKVVDRHEGQRFFRLFAIRGGKGGTGGNGGRGGKGGLPGTIDLFELNNYSRISRSRVTGEDGENGKGGHGGVGGGNDHYQDIIALCEFGWWFGTWHKWTLFKTEIKKNYASRKSGVKGIDGANIKNMEHPKTGSGMSELEKAIVINEYKSYSRKNINDRFMKFSLIQFLNKLDGSNNVKNVYNTLGLIDELRGLEKQFHELKKDVDMLPYYQSLLNRISEYAKNPTQVERSYQYKKVLSYLYTATLGRIYNLQENLESNLIIDITSYLDSVKEDNDKLRDLKNAKNKVNVIKKYNTNYKNGIDIKIKEAKDLISKEITPEIDNIGTEIDNKINSLIDEVTALQEKNKAEQKQLYEKKRQLESALTLQSLFAPFKILGQVLSFLGPVGEVASLAIGVGSTTAESFIVDGRSNTFELPVSVSDLEALQGRIKAIGDQKVIRLKKTLEVISKEIKEQPEKFGNISVKISDIKDRLNKINGNSFNFREIKQLENELKFNLETEEELLRKSHEITTNKDIKKALVVIDNCKKVFQLTTTMLDTYSKYKTNRTKLDTINQAIASAENKFKELKEYEDKIYNTIAPILQNIKNDLDDIASKLDTKSKVALDVIKWQVQSTLGDIGLKMQQLTQKFEAKENLVHCIKKLKDGMTTLINVYNHIQDYQEHQKFADYISRISYISVDDISSELGEELGNAVRDLEITVRSSIILQRKQVAIDAFKQFVFPFAHSYLKEMRIPSHLELGASNNNTDHELSHLHLAFNQNNTSVDNSIYESTTQIEHIKSKLRQYKVVMAEHDGPIGIGEFTSHYDSTQPFFVWKNEQHKNAISKLLSGQEVVLKADIMNSSPDEDAIKFNTIELNFNSKNVTTQSVVNNMLKGFNISMTHMGDSYYRYNDKIYPLTTTSQVIWYYFERKENGDPVRRSIAYDKIKNGDFMLSPYALWKIKLINLRNKNKFSFKDLEIYKDAIDLELGGNGYYVNKGGVSEDLMVERYYKEIDTHNLNDVTVNYDELNTVSLLQGSTSTKIEGETIQDSEDGELATIVDKEYQVTRNRETYTKHENHNSKYFGWLHWLKLPSFNILPGAEAVATKEGSENMKGYECLSLDAFSIPIMNGITSIKDAVISKLTNLDESTSYSYAFEKMNNYTACVARKDDTNTSVNPTFCLNGSKDGNQTIDTVDINGNLILGQLVAHKIFGENKFLSNNSYLSPEQEQNMRLNKLAWEVLPIVNHIYLDNHIINGSDSDYYSAPQWYQEMYKDECEEMTRK